MELCPEMKTAGLIGGMSYHSTEIYYRLINQGITRALGGAHSASLMLASVDFAPLLALVQDNRWGEASQVLINHALTLERAGAELLALCSITAHFAASAIRAKSKIRLVHIGEALGDYLKSECIERVVFFGTMQAVSERSLIAVLEETYELRVVLPDATEQNFLDDIIFNELVLGKASTRATRGVTALAEKFKAQGVGALVLGCTELSLMFDPISRVLATADATQLHCDRIVQEMLSLTGN